MIEIRDLTEIYGDKTAGQLIRAAGSADRLPSQGAGDRSGGRRRGRHRSVRIVQIP